MATLPRDPPREGRRRARHPVTRLLRPLRKERVPLPQLAPCCAGTGRVSDATRCWSEAVLGTEVQRGGHTQRRCARVHAKPARRVDAACAHPTHTRTHTHTRGRRRGRRWLDCGKRLTAPGVRTITPRTLHAHLLRVSCTSIKLETRLEFGQRSDISPPNGGNAESVSGGCRLGGVLDAGAGAWGRGRARGTHHVGCRQPKAFLPGRRARRRLAGPHVCDRAPGTAPGGVTGCSAGCPQSRSA